MGYRDGPELFDVPCYQCGDMYMGDWEGPGFCSVDCAAAHEMERWAEEMDALGVAAYQAGQALYDLITASMLRHLLNGTGPYYHPPPDNELLGTSPLIGLLR